MDSSHNVWVGANSTLAKLNPVSGATSFLQLPQPVDSPAAEAARPQVVKGLHDIISMASDAGNDLAVAWSAGGSVTLINSGTDAVSGNVLLPDQTETTEVAYSGSGEGTLGVGLTDYAEAGQANRILLVGPDGTRTVANLPSWSVHSSTGGFIVSATGDGQVQSLAASGIQQSSIAQPALPSHPIVGGDIVSFKSFAIEETQTGLAVLNSNNSGAVAFRLPTTPCGEGSEGPYFGPTSSTVPPPTQCSERATQVAVDSAGTIWYVSSGPQASVGAIAAPLYGAA